MSGVKLTITVVWGERCEVNYNSTCGQQLFLLAFARLGGNLQLAKLFVSCLTHPRPFKELIVTANSVSSHRVVGLVVKASASRAEDLGFESRLGRDFSESSHTSDSKTGTPVVTLPGAWRYRVSIGTGRPDVSILRLGEVESLICSFYLSVAARAIVFADPSLRYTSLMLGR